MHRSFSKRHRQWPRRFLALSGASAMTKRSILLTGATGYIAGLLLPALRERYDLRLADTRSTDRDGHPVEGVVIADLLGASAADLEPLVAGVDTIVHCAYHRPAADDIQSQYDGE